jgi:hypothetical protein
MGTDFFTHRPSLHSGRRFALACVALGACTAGASGSAGTSDPIDATRPNDAQSTSGPRPSWSFTPSNLIAAVLPASEIDLLISTDTCGGRSEIGFDTDSGAITLCPEMTTKIRATNVAQEGGDEIALFGARTIRIEAGMTVLVRGARPLALIATDTVSIAGTLRASALGDEGFAGGWSALPEGKGDGRGPGAGIGSAPGGGGGGSYCGRGGAGGPNHTDAPGNPSGPSYGNPLVVPLRGGSSGGNGGIWEAGGGGGAIQIVARRLIHVTPTGVVNVGGGGGEREGSGGGSGGALLLEAPTVTIDGVLAANGGGGGSSAQFGEDATPDDHPAPGGMAHLLNTGEGGAGSAGTIVDGDAGKANPTFANGDYSGGGGGGAGFIRINANLDGAIITGIVSPARGTTCTTRGILPGP